MPLLTQPVLPDTGHQSEPVPPRAGATDLSKTVGAAQAEASPSLPSGGAAASATISVMTYNIQMGLNWPAARDLIRANPVDILCLQEVPEPDHVDRQLVRPRQILEDFDWPHDSAMLWYRSPHRIGNMTLTRGFITPGRRLGVPFSKPYGLASEVRIHGGRLTVINIHMTDMLGPPAIAFPVSEMYRLREALDLTHRYGRTVRRDSRASRHRNPVIAMGDFNTFWPSPACWVMRRHWTDSRSGGAARTSRRYKATRPTYGLPFIIDHIFVRGGISVLDYQVLDGEGSDHRAVVATLRVPVKRRNEEDS
ncbi:MAG: endonuclease/exonuclease/phosphatase family protein [Phycisphaerae bacterium]|nr:endonuclease/exonuclease/phosphatase family protein [Phycisphaerae bacterium]